MAIIEISFTPSTRILRTKYSTWERIRVKWDDRHWHLTRYAIYTINERSLRSADPRWIRRRGGRRRQLSLRRTARRSSTREVHRMPTIARRRNLAAERGGRPKWWKGMPVSRTCMRILLIYKTRFVDEIGAARLRHWCNYDDAQTLRGCSPGSPKATIQQFLFLAGFPRKTYSY